MNFVRMFRIKLLHERYGMVRMKAIANRATWWPGVDKNIKQQCKLNQKSSPLMNGLNTHAWAYVHINHLGPFQGKTILAVVHAHSK